MGLKEKDFVQQAIDKKSNAYDNMNYTSMELTLYAGEMRSIVESITTLKYNQEKQEKVFKELKQILNSPELYHSNLNKKITQRILDCIIYTMLSNRKNIALTEFIKESVMDVVSGTEELPDRIKKYLLESVWDEAEAKIRDKIC